MTNERESGRILSIRDSVVMLGLLINLGGLVWGAATISASVTNLKETVSILSSSMSKTIQVLNDQVSSNAVLQYRVTQLENANAQGRR